MEAQTKKWKIVQGRSQDERKNSDGDHKLKSNVGRLAISEVLPRRHDAKGEGKLRMFVVTNPTHYSIAWSMTKQKVLRRRLVVAKVVDGMDGISKNCQPPWSSGQIHPWARGNLIIPLWKRFKDFPKVIFMPWRQVLAYCLSIKSPKKVRANDPNHE